MTNKSLILKILVMATWMAIFYNAIQTVNAES